MSKITIVQGDILEWIGGKDLSYAKEEIINEGLRVIQNGKENGVTYGINEDAPLIEKVLPLNNTNVIVYFKAKKWKGEYGFDWFREKNAFIQDSEKYEDIVGKYYQFTDIEIIDTNYEKFQRKIDKYYTSSDKIESQFPVKSNTSTYLKYYITNGNAWYKERKQVSKSGKKESYSSNISETIHNFKKDPQYKEANNSLNRLKDQYSVFNFNWNNKGNQELVCYYGAYITLFPKTEYYGKSEAELELNISFLDKNEKPDSLIFKVDNVILDAENKWIGIDRLKIENPSEKETIKISCKSKIDFNTNKRIEVYAIKNKIETLAGCITMIAPKLKTLNIVTIGVKTIITKTGDTPFYGSPVKDWFPLFKKALGQALIKVNIIDKKEKDPIRIDISDTPNFKTLFQVDEQGTLYKTESFAYTMYQKFKSDYPEYAEDYFKLYFVDVDCKEKGEETETSTSGYSEIDSNWGVMFNNHKDITIAHECLHALGLPHTFFHRNGSFVYKAMETNNLMDYSHLPTDPASNSTRTPKERYYTWYWQWKIVNPEIL